MNTGFDRACRPDTLPLGGLVYASEGGASCSCGLSCQTVFALSPALPAAARAEEKP